MSCMRRMENITCPGGEARRPVETRSCTTMAVEESATMAMAGWTARPTAPAPVRIAAVNLKPAKAEHQAPHGPQPRPRQFEPDDEEKENHAEFCDVADAVRIGDGNHVERQAAEPLGKGDEPERADRHTRHEVAKDRVEPEALQDRHHDARANRKMST